MSDRSSTQSDPMVESRHVETHLNYLEESQKRPAYYLRDSDDHIRRPAAVKHPVNVYDGRDLAPTLDLDEHGFTLQSHETQVLDFYDPKEVEDVYYPEVEKLVQDLTGAAKVVVFDHNVRCAPRCAAGEKGVRAPVKFAHNDYTLSSGPQRVRDVLQDKAHDLIRRRFAVINVWRPIRGPVEEHPLAVCDARTIPISDFVETDLVYGHRTGEIYSVSFNPRHRWFYFPRMQIDEVMLLKCYDSSNDGRARFTAHCAFNDPTSPIGATPRESVEVRTFAFFAPDA